MPDIGRKDVVLDKVDTVVVGAGAIGLAVGKALAETGREVVLLEAHDAIGTETSSRNSEVIHAGIYYPTGSLKARLCVAGRKRLYAYCESHGVPHAMPGKLIVATSDEEIDALSEIQATATANGVDDLRWMSVAEARELEPVLACSGALFSPSTGLVDSHALMLSYLGDLESAGGQIAFRTEAIGAEMTAGGFVIRIDDGSAGVELECRELVNSGGLRAQAFSRKINGLQDFLIPPRHLCKGHYFALSGSSPFSHLIYPAPAAAGLGIHVTLDLGGQTRFGPDIDWMPSDLEELDYTVDEDRKGAFVTAIQRYWPDLDPDALIPAYSGIRPKIQAEGEPAQDFVIQGPGAHGLKGLVNLYGIESPGLTSSLAIADYVTHLLA